MRRVDTAGKQPASLHHLMARVVHGRGRVIATAHERKLVGVLGMQRKNLGDFQARRLGLNRLERPANFGGGVRLHVKRVKLAGRPRLKIRITLRLSRSPATAPAALAAINWGSERPMAPNVPTCRKSRRSDAVAGMGLAASTQIEHGSLDRPGGSEIGTLAGSSASVAVRLPYARRKIKKPWTLAMTNEDSDGLHQASSTPVPRCGSSV